MTENNSIEVTSEMVDAGLTVYEQLHETYASYLLVEEVYKAMWKHRKASSAAETSSSKNDDLDVE